jgi:hypothetical protein
MCEGTSIGASVTLTKRCSRPGFLCSRGGDDQGDIDGPATFPSTQLIIDEVDVAAYTHCSDGQP